MTFGGFEIAMMAGAMRGAAARGVLLLVDGVITSAAYRVALNDYAVFCRCSDEHGHRALLRYLDAKPLLHLGLRLGEGSGAALVAGVLRTGAFHEDGLANFYDGVYGGLSIARRLEIMKDSRVGTYGVLALLSVLGLKFAALASLPPAYLPLILIAGHALSRAFAVSFIYRHACVRSDGGKVQVMAKASACPSCCLSAPAVCCPCYGCHPNCCGHCWRWSFCGSGWRVPSPGSSPAIPAMHWRGTTVERNGVLPERAGVAVNTELVLIRHTQVAVSGVCYGRLDVPLAASIASEAAMPQGRRVG